jgi:hypothetical protein
MVQAMDHEAVEGDMDQEAEGDIDGASDGRSNGWYKRWVTKQSKEISIFMQLCIFVSYILGMDLYLFMYEYLFICK